MTIELDGSSAKEEVIMAEQLLPELPLRPRIVALEFDNSEARIVHEMYRTLPKGSPLPSKYRTCAGIDGSLDLSGRAQTGGDGTYVWRLSEHRCPNSIIPIEPVSFLVTPLTSDPVVSTVDVVTGPDEAELTVTVRTWDLQGKPAPQTAFSWRSWIPYRLNIL